MGILLLGYPQAGVLLLWGDEAASISVGLWGDESGDLLLWGDGG